MKYFYTDPLKAVYMAREFNVGTYLAGQEDCLLPCGQLETLALIVLEKYDHLPKWKYFIHPDCHEMLKPQVGDLLKTVYAHHDEYWMYREERQLLTRYNKAEIIQRNGKVFFSPERSLDSHLPTVNINDFLKDK